MISIADPVFRATFVPLAMRSLTAEPSVEQLTNDLSTAMMRGNQTGWADMTGRSRYSRLMPAASESAAAPRENDALIVKFNRHFLIRGVNPRARHSLHSFMVFIYTIVDTHFFTPAPFACQLCTSERF